MKKDKDNLDDLFHSKLYDFEEDILPEDWEEIESRLPRPSISVNRRKWYYQAVAAIAALLITFSGIYYFKKDTTVKQQVAQETSILPEIVQQETTEIVAQAVPSVPIQWLIVQESEEPIIEPITTETTTDVVFTKTVPIAVNHTKKMIETSQFSLKTKDVSIQMKPKVSPAEPKRKWSFGMGAGNISAGNNSTVGSFALRSSSIFSDEGLALLNAANAFQSPKTEVHHKTPISFGISVSRYLTDRWSLQTGLFYSFLASDWKTNTTYRGESKQRLHFVGIPVSVSYKIAEWKRFQFYASAGGQVELNVAGKVRSDLYSPVGKIASASEKQRVKEPYFSINGNVGVSYPIVRFISAYAEVGADYYFDNGSDIETYYTEKPFRFGLQLGLRFGF